MQWVKSRLPLWQVSRQEFTESPEYVVIVMGPTGSGKSTFINTAARAERLSIGHGLDACTRSVETVLCRSSEGGKLVLLVESPAFALDARSQKESAKQILTWFDKALPSTRSKLAGVLYLGRISDPRMTISPLHHIGVFQKLFGDKFPTKILFLTTMWGSTPPAKAYAREADLRNNHWRPLISLGSQMMPFNNTAESAWEAVDALCNQAERIKPDLQPTPSFLLPRRLRTLLPINALRRQSVRMDPPLDDAVIAIVGLSGSGKSSLVNVLAGQSVMTVGHSLDPCTTTIKTTKVHCPLRSDYDILLVDTPGIEDDGQLSEVLHDMVSLQIQRLAGVLYLHRIAANRVFPNTPTDIRREILASPHLCATDIPPVFTIATSMWGELDKPETGIRRENDLRQNYFKDLVDKGVKIVSYQDETPVHAWPILNDIICTSNDRFEHHLQLELDGLVDKICRSGSLQMDIAETTRNLVQQTRVTLKTIRKRHREGPVIGANGEHEQYGEHEELRRRLQSQFKAIEAEGVQVGKHLLATADMAL